MFQSIRRNMSNLSNQTQTQRDLRRKEIKISNLIFEAKYYLVIPKIILMALYSIFLQNDHSLFPPFE